MKLRARGSRRRTGRLAKERVGTGKTAFLQLFFGFDWFCFEIGVYSVAQVTNWLPLSGDFPVSVSQVWELQA